MFLFPGISQIQTALIGMAAGALLAGVGVGVLEYKIEHARYDRLVASQATAHSQALIHEAAAQTAFNTRLTAAQDATAAVAKQLDAERAKKQTVLVQTLHDEGKKDATLAHCLSYKLPAGVLSNLAH